MTIVVDHEARRTEIMRKTLKLIGERGYGEVTYQQISEACGLSRTTLYKYFRNKQEIFDRAIYELVNSIGRNFEAAVRADPCCTVVGKIRLLCADVIDTMATNPPLIQAIIEYLIGLRRRGDPVTHRVRMHTIGLHRLLSRLVRARLRHGELRPMATLRASETMYALLESATVRLTLLEDFDRQHYINLFDEIIAGWRRP